MAADLPTPKRNRLLALALVLEAESALWPVLMCAAAWRLPEQHSRFRDQGHPLLGPAAQGHAVRGVSKAAPGLR